MSANPQTLIVPAEARERSTPPAVITDPASLMTAIARAASDPSTDVEKMERLWAMFERVEQRNAEAAFNQALSDAQAEMRPVATDAENDSTHSRYATYAALDRAIRPIYTKHGLSLSFDEGDSPKPDHVRVLCYVSRGGYTRTYRKDIAADGKGPKGNAVMTLTHASGAASSYGMRYLLKMIFNIAVGEDDTDGNMPPANVEKITAAQVADLEKRLADVGASPAAFLQYVKLEKLADIPADKYSFCVKAIEGRRKAPASNQKKERK